MPARIAASFPIRSAQAAPAKLGIPFLGRVPLEMAIRAASDAGEPPAAGNGPAAQLFAGLAQRVDDWLKG